MKNVQRRAGVIKEMDYAVDYMGGYRNGLMKNEGRKLVVYGISLKSGSWKALCVCEGL